MLQLLFHEHHAKAVLLVQ